MVVAGGRGMASLWLLHPSSGEEWPAGVASSRRRMTCCLVASFRWEKNGAAARVASFIQRGTRTQGWKLVGLAGEVRLAVEAEVVVSCVG